MRFAIFLSLFLSSAIFARAQLITKMLLNSEALDRSICPSVTRALDARLRSSAFFSWKTVVDDSISKVHIGVPPADTRCRHELLASENRLRLYLTWSLIGESDFQLNAVADLAWQNEKVAFACNAITAVNEKVKINFDVTQLTEDVCKELKGYFTQTPSSVVFPIADLNLVYSLKEVKIDNDFVTVDLSSVVEPSNTIYASKSIQLSQGDSKTVHLGIDPSLINTIFESALAKFSDQNYSIDSENNTKLKIDCGNPAVTAEPNSCLGSYLQSIMPQAIQNRYIDCDIKVETAPKIKIEKGAVVLRTNGRVIINVKKENGTLVEADYRLVSRLNGSVAADKRLIASTSINDFALMMSDFEIGERVTLENRNETTKEIVKLLAPIFVDLINNQLEIGLPLPLPQILKLSEAKIGYDNDVVEIKSDLSTA